MPVISYFLNHFWDRTSVVWYLSSGELVINCTGFWVSTYCLQSEGQVCKFIGGRRDQSVFRVQWLLVSRWDVRNQMVPSRAEWRGETDNRATPPVGYCPSTASFSVRPHCKNARRDRCQEHHNCFPFGGLEETTGTSWNYVDEDYSATHPWWCMPHKKKKKKGHSDIQGWVSECPDVKNYKWRLNPVWHRMLYHMATVGVKGLTRAADTRISSSSWARHCSIFLSIIGGREGAWLQTIPRREISDA